ncbi:MAG: DNA primase DnaG [Candidatus Micrarchaeia archaeon]|jgi:DNA primase
MGKTYIDAVKYLIKANLEVDGIVEKPDIVGAVFGQTEGLLGDELDLRELQKNGRIGRIEVDTNVRSGKCFGTLLVPSSLDMAETSILAAALEVVDRVGPCDARILVTKIEDTRNLKRKQVLDRARNLLKTMLVEEIPESKELTELVREDAKVSEIVTYGEDKLPAGPEAARNPEVIFVEGRADVVNMLRNNIKNVVAIGGANVGKTIAQLGREKEVTVFLDGDRGGDIILKELTHATDIDFVARAPTGKEVEELTRKEIIMCLRRRVPMEQYEAGARASQQAEFSDAPPSGPQANVYDRDMHRRLTEGPAPSRGGRVFAPRQPVVSAPQSDSQAIPPVPVPSAHPVAEAKAPSPGVAPEELEKLERAKVMLKELEGSLKARLLDADLNVSSEVPIREIMKHLSDTAQVAGVVLDGIVTQRLIDLAEQKGAKYVVGLRAGNISRKPAGMHIALAAE